MKILTAGVPFPYGFYCYNQGLRYNFVLSTKDTELPCCGQQSLQKFGSNC